MQIMCFGDIELAGWLAGSVTKTYKKFKKCKAFYQTARTHDCVGDRIHCNGARPTVVIGQKYHDRS